MRKERLDSMPDLSFSFLDSGDDGAEEGFDAGSSMYAIGEGSEPQQPAPQATADDPMVFGNLDEVADADASTDNDAAVSDLYEDPMDDYQPASAATAPVIDPEPVAAPSDSTMDDQPPYGGGVDPSFTSLDPIDDPAPAPSVVQQPAAMQPQYSRPSQPQYQQPVPAAAAPQYQPAQPASPAGYAQPQHTVLPVVSRMMSHSASTGDVQLDLIKKIIAVVDVYRHLDQNSQGIVKEFLDTLSKIGKAPAVDDSEAGVIKAIIEIEPDMREGVVDLMSARDKGGSERAFFLFGMSARRLENMDLILQMLSLSDGSLKVNDSIDSIRQASLTIDTCLNEKLRGEPEAFLKPVYDVLKETQKIMEG